MGRTELRTQKVKYKELITINVFMYIHVFLLSTIKKYALK